MVRKERKSGPVDVDYAIKPPKSRKEMGITKFYKAMKFKRTLVLLPEGTWRTIKDLSLDNGETFTDFYKRALQREIDRQLAKSVEQK